jgi:LysM repeat protein
MTSPATSSTVRLTRRGRLVIVLATMAALFVVFSLGQVSLKAATDTEPPLPTRQVTVHAGDTLWTIAGKVAPDADRREVMDQLRRLNDLDGTGLIAGQPLVVPA